MIALPAFATPRLMLAGAAILVLLLGLYTWGEMREQDGRDEVMAEWDAERAVMWRERAELADQVREAEHRFQRARQEAADAQAAERQRNSRAVAAVAADRDRLRSAVEAYAAGGGLRTGDTAASASERAAKLGRALDEALSAHAACVGDLVDSAADVRALRRGWPTGPDRTE